MNKNLDYVKKYTEELKLFVPYYKLSGYSSKNQ